MSFSQKDSLHFTFPYLLCCAPVSSNISLMAGQNLMRISQKRDKNPADSENDVRIDV